VFSLGGGDVFFVSVNGAVSYTITDSVPEYAVPTRGGPVSDKGQKFVLEISGNDTELLLETVTGWVAFSDIEAVPFGSEDYSVPPL
jgi:hypothetical protein